MDTNNSGQQVVHLLEDVTKDINIPFLSLVGESFDNGIKRVSMALTLLYHMTKVHMVKPNRKKPKRRREPSLGGMEIHFYEKWLMIGLKLGKVLQTVS